MWLDLLWFMISFLVQECSKQLILRTYTAKSIKSSPFQVSILTESVLFASLATQKFYLHYNCRKYMELETESTAILRHQGLKKAGERCHLLHITMLISRKNRCNDHRGVSSPMMLLLPRELLISSRLEHFIFRYSFRCCFTSAIHKQLLRGAYHR